MAENRISWGRPKPVGSARNPTDKIAPKEYLRGLRAADDLNFLSCF